MTITDTASTAKAPPLTELVAEEIRALLARRRISGRELARRMGASYSWVNFRLTGAQPIDLNDLQRIADVLDVEVLDLLPQREGRVVTHIGAPRVQTTVPKMGSPIALTKRPTGGRPHGRTSALPPKANPATPAHSAQRVTRTLATAA